MGAASVAWVDHLLCESRESSIWSFCSIPTCRPGSAPTSEVQPEIRAAELEEEERQDYHARRNLVPTAAFQELRRPRGNTNEARDTTASEQGQESHFGEQAADNGASSSCTETTLVERGESSRSGMASDESTSSAASGRKKLRRRYRWKMRGRMRAWEMVERVRE